MARSSPRYEGLKLMFSRIVGGLAETIDPSITGARSDAGAGEEEAAAEIISAAESGGVQIAPEQKTTPIEDSVSKKMNVAPSLMPARLGMDNFSSAMAFLKAHKLQYPLAIVAGMIMLYAVYRPAFVVLSFIALGTASRLYQRYLRGLSFGIELIILGAAVTGRLYGAWPAALIGLVALPISVIYTEEEVKWLPIAMGGMVLVGFLAAYLPPMSMLMLGMILTLAYDISTCAIYLFVFNARIFTTGIFIGTHLAFNYFVFSRFGETVLSLFA